MEGIVVGIARINFDNSFSDIANKNSAPSFSKESSTVMSVCDNFPPEEAVNVCHNDSILNEADDEKCADSGWEEIEDDLENTRQNRKGCTLAERRQMPTRASKESSLLGIRRTIMKPTKRIKKHADFQNLKPADIRKIYLNKKLTKFKPSSLETIFEETSTVQNNEQGCSHLMGGRKIKRSLSFSDGFRYSKTLVNKRRAKIKKTFGKSFALKKISLEEFITKLNNSLEKNDDATSNDCLMQDERTEIKEFSCSDIFVSNTPVNLDEATTAKNPPSTVLSKELELSNHVSLL